jgi:hypothetical protein
MGSGRLEIMGFDNLKFKISDFRIGMADGRWQMADGRWQMGNWQFAFHVIRPCEASFFEVNFWCG